VHENQVCVGVTLLVALYGIAHAGRQFQGSCPRNVATVMMDGMVFAGKLAHDPCADNLLVFQLPVTGPLEPFFTGVAEELAPAMKHSPATLSKR